MFEFGRINLEHLIGKLNPVLSLSLFYMAQYYRLGLSTSCSATFWQLFMIRATIFLTSNLTLYFEQFRDRRSPKIIRGKGNTNVSKDLRSLPKTFEEHLKTFQLSAHSASKHYKTRRQTWRHWYLHDFSQLKKSLLFNKFPLN